MKTKDEVVAEAREHISAAREITRDLPTRLLALPVECASSRWRREADQAEAERKAERDSRLTDAEGAQLRRELHAAVASAVAAERAYWNEALPELLALVRQAITAEIDEKIGLLKADVTMHRSIDRADNVTELPSFLRKAST